MAEIIEMPKLSDTMTTGTLVKWLKKEGERVAAGDMLAEVETDKATMEVENFENGVLLKHYVKEGEAVAIGAPICAIGAAGETAPALAAKAPAAAGTVRPPQEQAGEQAQEQEQEQEQEHEQEREREEVREPAVVAAAPGGRIKASPLARKIAAALGVDLARVKGTGPGGRIVRADVEAAAKAGTAKPAGAPAGAAPALTLAGLEEKTEKVSSMRAAIARALVKSKAEAPHFYLQTEIDAGPLTRLRADLNTFLAELPPQAGGIKYTVNDLILRAAALAVTRVPAINRSWQGDTIRQHGAVHLAFGVAVEDGLVTPVIRDAERKPLRQIALEARDLIGKARTRKLKPEEMSGSTLTVTNLGMYGITDFYGIINPGNAAILSIGATIKAPVVDAQDRIVIGQRMKIGLSGDHRVIDGAVGAQYLDALRNLLEHPAILLV